MRCDDGDCGCVLRGADAAIGWCRRRGQFPPAAAVPSVQLQATCHIRRRRSPSLAVNDQSQAREMFHEIGGGRNAVGGFGHPGGDLAGPGEDCGARMVRRSATSDSRVVLEKRRAVPTFSRLTRAPQIG